MEDPKEEIKPKEVPSLLSLATQARSELYQKNMKQFSLDAQKMPFELVYKTGIEVVLKSKMLLLKEKTSFVDELLKILKAKREAQKNILDISKEEKFFTFIRSIFDLDVACDFAGFFDINTPLIKNRIMGIIGATFLHLAGHFDAEKEVIEELIKQGASVHAQAEFQKTPLFHLVSRIAKGEDKGDKENFELFKLFIKHGADINQCAYKLDKKNLLDLTAKHNTLIKEYLLKEGLRYSSISGNDDVQHLLRYEPGMGGFNGE